MSMLLQVHDLPSLCNYSKKALTGAALTNFIIQRIDKSDNAEWERMDK